MSFTDDQIQQIEQSIKDSSKNVEVADALARLYANRDFKKVILEGYLEKEAIRLVHAKADAALQSAESQKQLMNQIDAIGILKGYFHTIGFLGEQARKTISYAEEARQELITGEDDGR
jgi:hypothetical protein